MSTGAELGDGRPKTNSEAATAEGSEGSGRSNQVTGPTGRRSDPEAPECIP